jgi:predicted nucleotidyltransferase
VIRWPARDVVVGSFRKWVANARGAHPELEAAGYFGSCARGDDGPGSDLDVILVVSETDVPFERRAAGWDTSRIAVPVDLLVYTRAEFDRLRGGESRFAAMLASDAEGIVAPR